MVSPSSMIVSCQSACASTTFRWPTIRSVEGRVRLRMIPCSVRTRGMSTLSAFARRISRAEGTRASGRAVHDLEAAAGQAAAQQRGLRQRREGQAAERIAEFAADVDQPGLQFLVLGHADELEEGGQEVGVGAVGVECQRFGGVVEVRLDLQVLIASGSGPSGIAASMSAIRSVMASVASWLAAASSSGVTGSTGVPPSSSPPQPQRPRARTRTARMVGDFTSDTSCVTTRAWAVISAISAGN